jgi:hypothetical protein
VSEASFTVGHHREKGHGSVDAPRRTELGERLGVPLCRICRLARRLPNDSDAAGHSACLLGVAVGEVWVRVDELSRHNEVPGDGASHAAAERAELLADLRIKFSASYLVIDHGDVAFGRTAARRSPVALRIRVAPTPGRCGVLAAKSSISWRYAAAFVPPVVVPLTRLTPTTCTPLVATGCPAVAPLTPAPLRRRSVAAALALANPPASTLASPARPPLASPPILAGTTATLLPIPGRPVTAAVTYASTPLGHPPTLTLASPARPPLASPPILAGTTATLLPIPGPPVAPAATIAGAPLGRPPIATTVTRAGAAPADPPIGAFVAGAGAPLPNSPIAITQGNIVAARTTAGSAAGALRTATPATVAAESLAHGPIAPLRHGAQLSIAALTYSSRIGIEVQETVNRRCPSTTT